MKVIPQAKEATYKNIQKMLKDMKSTGGRWIAGDDPYLRLIGFQRVTEPAKHFFIPLTFLKETLSELDSDIRNLFKSAKGRQKIAEMCSS